MDFEQWMQEVCTREELEEKSDDPDFRTMMQEQYERETRPMRELEAHLGAGWLEEQRREMRGRVDEVLRYLGDEEMALDCKHSWLYTQIGEVEYAQLLGILSEHEANGFKDELFGRWNTARRTSGTTVNDALLLRNGQNPEDK